MIFSHAAAQAGCGDTPAQPFGIIDGQIDMRVISRVSRAGHTSKQHDGRNTKRRRGMMEPAFRQHSSPDTRELNAGLPKISSFDKCRAVQHLRPSRANLKPSHLRHQVDQRLPAPPLLVRRRPLFDMRLDQNVVAWLKPRQVQFPRRRPPIRIRPALGCGPLIINIGPRARPVLQKLRAMFVLRESRVPVPQRVPAWADIFSDNVNGARICLLQLPGLARHH